MRAVALRIAILTLALLTTAPAVADDWTLDEDVLVVAVADARWTVDDTFPGTKAVVGGRYVFGRLPLDDPDPHSTYQRLTAVVDASGQFGHGQTGLERWHVRVIPFVYQRDYDTAGVRGLHRVRDHAEWGAVRHIVDDPLGLERYTEIVVGRLGRMWAYKKSESSRFSFRFGFKSSLGWSVAESIAEEYNDVSNPFIGAAIHVSAVHPVWGMLYTDYATAPGFSPGKPNESVNREARVRAGYARRFGSGLAVDVFFEKRSFNFDDPVLPSFYTQSRRIGAALSWRPSRGANDDRRNSGE